MLDLVALLVLAAALGGLAYFHWREAQAWRAERANLLDRLMAQNWGAYLAGNNSSIADRTPQLLTDDAEAKWHQTHAAAGDETPYVQSTDVAWHQENYRQHPDQYPDGIPA